jgi:hypothetical protein
MRMAQRLVLGAWSSAGSGLVARAAALCLVSIFSTSCANVLGIEDASCDPSYAPDCAGQGAGGNSGGTNTGIAPLNPAGTKGASGASGAGVSGVGGSAMVAGAAGSVSGTAAGDTDASPLCQQYCDVVAANCVGTDAQFASPLACLSVCALLPPGTPGDTSGNTVECRLSRAQLAATTGEPSNYCFSAGPGGAGSCGSNCDGFCAVMTQKCTQLGDDAACLQACAEVPDLSLGTPKQNYNIAMMDGDSLQCRLFHVSAASVDPVTHCIHAAGQAVCE